MLDRDSGIPPLPASNPFVSRHSSVEATKRTKEVSMSFCPILPPARPRKSLFPFRTPPGVGLHRRRFLDPSARRDFRSSANIACTWFRMSSTSISQGRSDGHLFGCSAVPGPPEPPESAKGGNRRTLVSLPIISNAIHTRPNNDVNLRANPPVPPFDKGGQRGISPG